MLQSLLFVCVAIGAVIGADDPKTKSPRELREAQEKAIKAKMAPIEKKLTAATKQLEYSKSAVINGKSSSSTSTAEGLNRVLNYRNAEQKKEQIDKYQKQVDQYTSELKPLKDELAALKKKPIPKPETKP